MKQLSFTSLTDLRMVSERRKACAVDRLAADRIEMWAAISYGVRHGHGVRAGLDGESQG
jgi:hypothetical protein